ncbi:MAG: hypothetical protein JO081_12130 [Alphaproteobacteria bacterium]|nr:hypothetical protein [Alphaproteobacteria bacterium]
MISRIVSTGVLVLLSAGAFLSQATFAENSDSTVFLLFGAVVGLFAVLNWFAWSAIREGWDYGQRPSQPGPGLPVSASFWPVYIDGLLNAFSAAGLPWAKPGPSTRSRDRRP